MKNKIISLILSIVTIFTLTACDTGSHDKLRIVTTIFPQYDFAKQIIGENAEVTLLIAPGSESHTYEPTAADIAKIQQADLFIYNGGESEIWVDRILDSGGKNKDNTLRLMDFVSPAAEEHDDHDSHKVGYDEHIFTSLRNSEKLLDAISEKICILDSGSAETYKKNTEKYKTEIKTLDEDFTEMISSAKRKTVIFGDRFPFRYFADDYGLECYAAFSGCSSETEASPATISDLICKIQENSIPVVFYIEFSNKSIAEKIAKATGIKTSLLHSCHNISQEDLSNNVTYVDLMKNNYKNLSEALN